MSEADFAKARMSKLEPWMDHQAIVDLQRDALVEQDKRLSAATALLERLNTWNETEGTTDDLVSICADTAGFLSSAPEQPAASDPGTVTPRPKVVTTPLIPAAADVIGVSASPEPAAPSLLEQALDAEDAALFPAQPAAPAPAECDPLFMSFGGSVPGYEPAAPTRWGDGTAEFKQPAAPELSAGPLVLEYGMRWMKRAEAAESQLASAEAEMRRLGYGVEQIWVFREDGTPLCTSHVGDLAWDTVANKRRTFEFIKAAEAQLAAVSHRLQDVKSCLSEQNSVNDTLRTQLAAVREALTNVHVMNSQDAGQVVCASVVDDALALLTLAPSPSPGAGTKGGGK